jgi:hypothetical protein
MPIEKFLALAFKAKPRLHIHTDLHQPIATQWQAFNDSVRALGKEGEIRQVSAAGPFDDRFDIVQGVVDGLAIEIYGPRYRDPRPEDMGPAFKVKHDNAYRDLVRQVEESLNNPESSAA